MLHDTMESTVNAKELKKVKSRNKMKGKDAGLVETSDSNSKHHGEGVLAESRRVSSLI
jgi:hypothetical protein